MSEPPPEDLEDDPWEPPTEEWDDERSFGQFADAPDGTRFCVTAARGYGVSGPVFLGVEGDHPWAQRLVRLVNPLLTRVQPPARTEETAHIEVCRATSDDLIVLVHVDAEDMTLTAQLIRSLPRSSPATSSPPEDE
jgi:hypothetical protein